jgi:hypothetical protein
MDKQLIIESFELKSAQKVWQAVNTLEKLEFSYNMLAVLQYAAERALPFNVKEELSERMNRIFELADRDLALANQEMRSWLPEEAHLELTAARAGSLKISVQGVAEILKTLGQIFDPLSRKEREEEIRHLNAMNQLKEQEEYLHLLERRLKLTLYAQTSVRLNHQLPAQEADKLYDRAMEYIAKAISELESRDINMQKMLGAPEDTEQGE